VAALEEDSQIEPTGSLGQAIDATGYEFRKPCDLDVGAMTAPDHPG
jgi:hypothetical protein